MEIQTTPGIDTLSESQNTTCKRVVLNERFQERTASSLERTLRNTKNTHGLFKSSELHHKGQSSRGCSFYSHCHLKPQASPIQKIPLNTKTCWLEAGKVHNSPREGVSLSVREILSSSATEQVRSFLKEEAPRDHLKDKDHKSTDRLRSRYGCPLLGFGCLKIALRVQSPPSLCPKKAKELSKGSGHLSLKPDASCEVTASPAIKGSLSKGGPTQGLERPSTHSSALPLFRSSEALPWWVLGENGLSFIGGSNHAYDLIE